MSVLWSDMADKVLFDTNVALDVLLQRPDTFSESNKLWKANDKGLIIGFLTAPSVRDIHYFITRERNDSARALQAVLSCLSSFHICPVDGSILAQAAAMSGPDFEDNIQVACVLAQGLDAIVTRNIKDFRDAGITLYTPAQLVKKLKLR